MKWATEKHPFFLEVVRDGKTTRKEYPCASAAVTAYVKTIEMYDVFGEKVKLTMFDHNGFWIARNEG